MNRISGVAAAYRLNRIKGDRMNRLPRDRLIRILGYRMNRIGWIL